MERQEWMQWEERRMRQELISVASAHQRDAAQAARAQIAVLERSAEAGNAMREELAALREAQGKAHLAQEAGLREVSSSIDRGFAELGDRLCSQLDSIDASLSNIGDLLDAGFAQVTELLQQIGTKLEWSEQYRQFLRLKKEAFELARHGDRRRAVQQGLQAISLRGPGGVVEDQIERDPLLCAFLARILIWVRLNLDDGRCE